MAHANTLTHRITNFFLLLLVIFNGCFGFLYEKHLIIFQTANLNFFINKVKDLILMVTSLV